MIMKTSLIGQAVIIAIAVIALQLSSCIEMPSEPPPKELTFPLTPADIYDTPGSARGVFVVGEFAYVADGDFGLQILDISNPSNITLSGSHITSEHAVEVSVLGNYAYVGLVDSGVQVFNVANPSNPVLVGSNKEIRSGWGISVSGNYAYIADFWFYVLNVSDPANPLLVGQYQFNFMTAIKLDVVGNYAYLADADTGLLIVDVSNPSNPSLIGNYYQPGNTGNIYVSGDYCYLSGDYGLTVIDISNKYSPTLVTTMNIERSPYIGGYGDGVYVHNNYAYITASDQGINVVEVFGPNNPYLAGNDSAYWANDVHGSGNGVMVAAITGGVRTYVLPF